MVTNTFAYERSTGQVKSEKNVAGYLLLKAPKGEKDA